MIFLTLSESSVGASVDLAACLITNRRLHSLTAKFRAQAGRWLPTCGGRGPDPPFHRGSSLRPLHGCLGSGWLSRVFGVGSPSELARNRNPCASRLLGGSRSRMRGIDRRNNSFAFFDCVSRGRRSPRHAFPEIDESGRILRAAWPGHSHWC